MIYVLDEDPVKSARALCDTHLRAQLRELDGRAGYSWEYFRAYVMALEAEHVYRFGVSSAEVGVVDWIASLQSPDEKPHEVSPRDVVHTRIAYRAALGADAEWTRRDPPEWI